MPVNAGDRFILLVTNYSADTTGYYLRFYTPADSAGFADVTQGVGLGIRQIDYDPTCTGNCPVHFTLTQPLRCSGVEVQVYNPANVAQAYNASVACNPAALTVSDTITVYGDFDPTDTTLAVVLRARNSLDYLYQCSNTQYAIDTIPLQLIDGGVYRTVTANTVRVRNQVQFSPNPFSQTLSVTLPNAGLPFSVRLTDATGRQVYARSGLAGGQSHQLELPADLPPGLYTAEVSSGELRVRRQLVRR